MNGVVDGFFRLAEVICHVLVRHVTDIESEYGFFEIRQRLVNSAIQMAKRFFTDDDLFRGIKIGFVPIILSRFGRYRKIVFKKTADIGKYFVPNARFGVRTEGYGNSRLVGERRVIECDQSLLSHVFRLGFKNLVMLAIITRHAVNQGKIETVNCFKGERFATLYIFKKNIKFGMHGITTFKNINTVQIRKYYNI